MYSAFVPSGSDAVVQDQLENPDVLWHLLRELKPNDDGQRPAVEIADGTGASLILANTETGIVLMLAPDDNKSYHVNPYPQERMDDTKTVSFTYMGSYTEVPAAFTLPEKQARFVTEAFFSGGFDSAFLAATWEED
jgi:hypothetical protein